MRCDHLFNDLVEGLAAAPGAEWKAFSASLFDPVELCVIAPQGGHIAEFP